ncbi:MAG TPA: hypothetical protein V6C50_09330, partial [Crinalium sp.]
TVAKVMEAQEAPAPTPAPLSDAAAQPIKGALAVNAAPTIESDRQIRRLQQRVRLLTGILVGVVLLWGGSVLLPYYNTETGTAQSQENVQHP